MKKEIKEIVGKTQKEAVEHLKKHKFSLRVTKEDDKFFFGDCMADPKRVNVEIKNGKIVNILGIN